MKIETPTALPAEWHAKYLVLRLRYRNTRMWETDAQADEAAFKDTRSEFWRGVSRTDNQQTNNALHERTAAP